MTWVHTSAIYSVQTQAIFIFISFFYERQFCARRPKHICLFLNTCLLIWYIHYKLYEIRPNQKTLNSRWVKRKLDYYWSIICFVVFAFIESTLFNHQHTKLHLKSPKHFISLASFHLIVYTKIISISSPLYNAVFFNIQVSISMIKRSQWLCYVCVKEFPISYYIKIFHI